MKRKLLFIKNTCYFRRLRYQTVMPKQLLALPALLLSITLLAQPLQKPVQDAYLVSRMAARFHVQPRPLDDSLSALMYASLLDELDGQQIFFTQEDIRQLAAYRYKLDDEVRDRQSGFL